jgi:GAF domain-containing protein/HAMP domain-containing protein
MNPLVLIASIPLRAKLTLGLALSVILVTVLAGFAINQYGQAIEPASNVIIRTLARERGDALNAIIDENLSLVQLVAKNPLNIVYFSTLTTSRTNAAAIQKIEQTFQDILNLYPSIRQMRFVRADGEILVSSPRSTRDSDAGETYYQAMKNNMVTDGAGNAYIGRSGTADDITFDFVVVPTQGNQPLGFVVATLDPSGSAGAVTSLYDTLRTVSPESGIVIFYLVDADGNIISPVIRPIGGPQSIAGAAKLAKEPFSQPTSYTSPVSGVSAIGLTVPVDVLRMTLVAETRVIQLGGSNESGRFILRTLVLVAASLLILLLIAVFWETTLIRPVRRLLAATTGSAQGSTTGILRPIRQRDEIGGLYSAFAVLNSQLRQDITTLEDRIAQRTRDIEATRDIGQIISSIRDLDRLLREVIELIRTRFENVYHAQIFLLDANQEYAVLRASTGEAGERLLARGHRLAIGSQSVIGQVTSTGRPVVALDTSTSPVHRGNELLPHTRAELALPLRAGEEIIGALDLQSTRTDAFSEADIRLFQTMADQVTVAISNAQLFEELQVRVHEIEDLNRQLIGEAWRDYVSARRRPLPIGSVGETKPAAESALQRRAVETGQVAERIGPDLVTLAVPVRLRGEVLGTVEWDMPRSAYNENTRQLAEELAARLAITADNARLFEQSQRLAERERLVNEVASKLTQQADVAQILKIAVREVGLALRVPQASIRLSPGRDAHTEPGQD